jgi:hypothetical protein
MIPWKQRFPSFENKLNPTLHWKQVLRHTSDRAEHVTCKRKCCVLTPCSNCASRYRGDTDLVLPVTDTQHIQSVNYNNSAIRSLCFASVLKNAQVIQDYFLQPLNNLQAWQLHIDTASRKSFRFLLVTQIISKSDGRYKKHAHNFWSENPTGQEHTA